VSPDPDDDFPIEQVILKNFDGKVLLDARADQ
jgi:hypothetical protein